MYIYIYMYKREREKKDPTSLLGRACRDGPIHSQAEMGLEAGVELSMPGSAGVRDFSLELYVHLNVHVCLKYVPY